MRNDSNNNNNDNTAIIDFTANRENTMKEELANSIGKLLLELKEELLLKIQDGIELASVLRALPQDQKKEFSDLYAKYKAQQDTNNSSAQDNTFGLFHNTTTSGIQLQQTPTHSEQHSNSDEPKREALTTTNPFVLYNDSERPIPTNSSKNEKPISTETNWITSIKNYFGI